MIIKRGVFASLIASTILLTACGESKYATTTGEVESVDCDQNGRLYNCGILLTDGRTFIDGGREVSYLKKGNKITIKYHGLNSIRSIQYAEDEEAE